MGFRGLAVDELVVKGEAVACQVYQACAHSVGVAKAQARQTAGAALTLRVMGVPLGWVSAALR